MKIKSILLLSILTFNVGIYAQMVSSTPPSNINNIIMHDSLLVLFGQQIEADLAMEGYNVLKVIMSDSIPFVGNYLVCELYFTPKGSCVLLLLNTSDTMRKKRAQQYRGWHFRKQLYFNAYEDYIEKHHELPYELIKYYRYQFISPYKSSPKDYAIYGDYKFSVSEEKGFEIIEKNTEVLKGKGAILAKLTSNF